MKKTRSWELNEGGIRSTCPFDVRLSINRVLSHTFLPRRCFSRGRSIVAVKKCANVDTKNINARDDIINLTKGPSWSKSYDGSRRLHGH